MDESGRLPASLRRRLGLYEKALRLHKKGLTRSQIGNELGVGKDTVGIWLRGGKPKRVSRYEPDLTPSRDLAYLAGFYVGDGKEAGEEHKVRFGLADPEQLDYVGGLIAKLLGREPKPLAMEGGFYVVQYDSVALSDFLHHDMEWLAEYLRDFVPDLLRGFFDAEGYVSPVINFERAPLDSVIVGAANTNMEYLKTVATLLSGLGIWSRMRATNKRGQTMTIRGKTWTRKRDVYHCLIWLGGGDEIPRTGGVSQHGQIGKVGRPGPS